MNARSVDPLQTPTTNHKTRIQDSPIDRPYRLAVLQSHPIQYAAPLFRYLAAQPDLDVTVYFCSRQGLEAYVDEGFGGTVQWDVPLTEGYRHRFLPNLGHPDSVSGFFRPFNPSIAMTLIRDRPDALWVHGHNYATTLLAMLTARVLRIPVMMRAETHLQLSRSRLKAAIRRPLIGLLYGQLCAAFLAIGTRNRVYYRDLGLPVHRIFDVPYVVDNNFFASRARAANHAEIRDALGIPDDRAVILFASKLTRRKRPMDLLRAYRLLREGGCAASLIILGSGEEEAGLRREVTREDIPDVHFLGFRNQSELPAFMAAADIFVLPSQDEPWGLVINEAMAAGLPVVAADEIGAVPDLVTHGVNGYVFPAGDVDLLSRYLRALVSDPDRRTYMGEASARRIARWNFAACARGVRRALATVSPRSETAAAETTDT